MIELDQEQEKQLAAVGKKFNLRFIILHGSYAKGTPHTGSDLDIAVLGRRRIGLDESLDIHGELGRIFGDNEERELDLKTLHQVDPFFRYLVVRDGILLFGDGTEYEEFRAYAFRDYMDSADLRKLEFRLLEKSIKELSQSYAG